jgi:hypothetical protein
MKNIIIYLIFMVMLIPPLFDGKATDIFIISIVCIILFLLLSGCTALVFTPLL